MIIFIRKMFIMFITLSITSKQALRKFKILKLNNYVPYGKYDKIITEILQTVYHLMKRLFTCF